MSSIQVRPFRRSDRDQLTQLVNAHAEAVVPGLSVSVNTVLASLERQPGEFIEDPWVAERVTLVAEQQNRVAAAAHLLRYFPDERAGQDCRDAGEIPLGYPRSTGPMTPAPSAAAVEIPSHRRAGNPYWPDSAPAASSLVTACLAQLRDWGVSREYAGGELPVHGVYGVPEQWPHVRALYQEAGFSHTGHTEIVYLARVEDLPRPASVPLAGLSVRRSAGINGCRLSAVLGQDVIGYIEVETFDEPASSSSPGPRGALVRQDLAHETPSTSSMRMAAPDADSATCMSPNGTGARASGSWLLGQAGRLARAGLRRPAAGLRLARARDGSRRGQLRGLPGLPPGGGLPRTHPHSARVDPRDSDGPGPASNTARGPGAARPGYADLPCCGHSRFSQSEGDRRIPL